MKLTNEALEKMILEEVEKLDEKIRLPIKNIDPTSKKKIRTSKLG